MAVSRVPPTVVVPVEIPPLSVVVIFAWYSERVQDPSRCRASLLVKL